MPFVTFDKLRDGEQFRARDKLWTKAPGKYISKKGLFNAYRVIKFPNVEIALFFPETLVQQKPEFDSIEWTRDLQCLLQAS